MRGTDGNIYDTFYSASSGNSGFYPLDADNATGSPATVIYNNQFHVTTTVTGGAVYDDYYSASAKRFSGFQKRASIFAGDPVTTVYNGQYHVTGISSGGNVYDEIYDPNNGGWQAPASLGAPSGGAAGKPAVTVYGSQLHFTVRTVSGAVYDKFYSSTSKAFSGWESLDGKLASDPVTTVFNDQFHVTGRSPGNQIFDDYYSPNTKQYGGFYSIGAPPGDVAGKPAVTVYHSQFHVTVRTSTGAVYDKFYGSGWSNWESLNGTFASDPATTVYSDQFHVTGVSANGNVYDNYYSSSLGHYDGFKSYGAPPGGATGNPAVTVYPPSNPSPYPCLNTDHCWGVDTVDAVTAGSLSDLNHRWGRNPDFIGQYLNTRPGSGLSSLTKDHADFAHSKNIGILLIQDEGQCTSDSVGKGYADDAASDAGKLSVPTNQGIFIFMDVEQGDTATSDCISSYVSELKSKGYQPGFYENPDNGDFSNNYCSAVSANSDVASAYLWSSEPGDTGSTTAANSPKFGPDRFSGCADKTVAWQYALPPDNDFNYDEDEIVPNRRPLLW
ncbi:glycoside hydrolase domain-containing protein [uncultured Jatrophihabitans sp.]|uniref:glycoside hydrolase domain-containing protein n=1 Tax=uncultured Jatrophihabitans sp. TaxID=1610747 RepID=UPI0035CC799A